MKPNDVSSSVQGQCPGDSSERKSKRAARSGALSYQQLIARKRSGNPAGERREGELGRVLQQPARVGRSVWKSGTRVPQVNRGRTPAASLGGSKRCPILSALPADHLRPARAQDWVVYAKAPFGDPTQVVDYVGRYTHRVAISNHR